MGKRGPKPKPSGRRNSVMLSVRAHPSLRAALAREAKRSKRSLSQEILRRLESSLREPQVSASLTAYGFDIDPARANKHQARNRALGAAIGQLAAAVEGDVGQTWNTDAYAHRAMVAAVTMLLDRFMPATALSIPKWVLAKLDGPRGEAYASLREPEGLGAMVAAGFIRQLETTQRPPVDHPSDTHYAAGYYLFPKMREDLGLEDTP